MAEKKQSTTVAPNKLAMSKALGAAFLNHQVEQLEKSVSGINAQSAGSWRRRQAAHTTTQVSPPNARRPPPSSAVKIVNRRHADDSQGKERGTVKEQGANGLAPVPQDAVRGRRSYDEDRGRYKTAGKDADIIVVDASVLVHALYQVKKWCRDGRDEIIIVPLEALNTLDLLKKGTSPLAQRARMASRTLEAQVGTNPRIRVQQDDAFVLWDKIEFQDAADSAEHNLAGKPTNSSPYSSPEWVRRTICCARWEVEHAAEETNGLAKKSASESGSTDSAASASPPLKVLLAVVATNATSEVTSSLNNIKLSSSPAQSIAPIPLPAPHVNKHEPRSSGALVAHWASRARIEMLRVDPAAPPSEDDVGGRTKRSSRSRRPSDGGTSGKVYHGHVHTTGLVERPPAVKAMMEMVAQPSRVVRVLARGEKLDPDT